VITDWHAPNVLNNPAPVDGSWSTANLAEALPGVPTPLGWSIWARAADRAARAPFHAMGALRNDQFQYPARSEDRVVNLFYGRIAVRVDFFCRAGDLVPGATGEAIARDAFGFVPTDFVSEPSKERWLPFAAKMPVTLVRAPRRVRTLLARNQRWYADEIARAGRLDLAASRAQYREAARRFDEAMTATAVSIACVIQPAFTALCKLAGSTNADSAALMRSQGSHEELATVTDLWRVARGDLDMPTFLAAHGYQGRDIGELSNPSWREDPAQLDAVCAGYRKMGDDAAPAARARAGAIERQEAEEALFAALPAVRRPAATLTLRLARNTIPLRAVGKTAYVLALDVARAAARRIGVLLDDSGELAEPDDVFYLTGEEMLGALPADLSHVIAERRDIREHYRSLTLPGHWTGPPSPVAAATYVSPAPGAQAVRRLLGVGVSSGIAEGRARVVTDPAETDLEPGEILVAHTTDPSWASVMFMAKALVVDIGGQMSHAAVVAREMGVPCVMNTATGTRQIHTGDRIRVDGAAGIVDIL